MRAGLVATAPPSLSASLDLDLVVMNLAGTAVRDEGVVLYSLLRVAQDHDLDMDPSAVAERLGQETGAAKGPGCSLRWLRLGVSQF